MEQWKEAFEEATSEGLADDTALCKSAQFIDVIESCSPEQMISLVRKEEMASSRRARMWGQTFLSRVSCRFRKVTCTRQAATRKGVNITKDAIGKREMLSIQATVDDRFEFAFELNTTKHGSRVYLFAAETEQDRDEWAINIAKSFACLPENALKHIQVLDRGGVVFIQEGATNVMTLQSTGRCVETYDNGHPFVVDLPNRALYIQGDTHKETEDWFATIHTASTESGTNLWDQQLTVDDTPVIIDKCINFVAMHGE
ncbi:hypothetical protein LSAT2_026334 [Lamellibrachia satsuma]|nr:hypothetical protein LSAT2_026334 [Lamellibrachia satsuma]